jgi:hypothetical protein
MTMRSEIDTDHESWISGSGFAGALLDQASEFDGILSFPVVSSHHDKRSAKSILLRGLGDIHVIHRPPRTKLMLWNIWFPMSPEWMADLAQCALSVESGLDTSHPSRRYRAALWHWQSIGAPPTDLGITEPIDGSLCHSVRCPGNQ